MSTAATDPAASTTATNNGPASGASVDKGKNKVAQDDAMEDDEEEDEEEDDDDDDGEEEEDEEEEEEDSLAEIDPEAIRPRRTRGIKVDYTSPEALAKAGLAAKDDADEEDDEDVNMKDD